MFLNLTLKYFLICVTLSFTSMFQFGYILCNVNTAYLSFVDFLNTSSQLHYNTSITTASGTAFMTASIMVYVPELLGFGRAIVGLGSGISANVITLLFQETSPTRARGFTSSLIELSVTLTSFLGCFMGISYICGSDLVLLCALGCIPDMIQITVLLFCPDSPKHLLLVKKDELRAHNAIVFYQGQNANVEKILCNFREEGSQDLHTQRVTLRTLWVERHLRAAVLVGCVGFILQECSGIVVMAFFSTQFLTAIGISQKWAEIGSALLLLINFVATAFALLLVTKVGRRRLLLITDGLVILMLVIYIVFALLQRAYGWFWLPYACITTLVVYIIVFSFGPGPLPWFITAELVPQHVRSLAQSVSQTVNTVSVFVLGLTALPLYDYIQEYSFIIMFVVPSLACLMFLYFKMPETRNREIAQIVAELRQRTSNKQLLRDEAVSMTKF